MLKYVSLAFLCGVAGYIVGAAAGMFLVYALSANIHDQDVEALMTGLFFAGPLMAGLCFLACLLVLWRRGRRG
jgi:hypothetical protein